MIDEAKSGIEAARSAVSETVRANPIPLALIGLGVAWLVASNTRIAESIAADERLRAAGRRIGETIGAKAGDGLAAVKEAETVGWVHQAAGAARGALRTVTSSVTCSGAELAERAGQYAAEAGDRASRVSGRLSEAIERHPLLVGAIGLVSGAAIATFLPLGKNAGRACGTERRSTDG